MRASLDLGKPFDLVVSDVMLGWGEKGPAMLQRFKQNLGVSFPLLFISGYSKQTLIADGLLDAGQAFLEKPFQMSELVGKVRSMLGRVKMEEPGEI